jgi:hypothetical protein
MTELAQKSHVKEIERICVHLMEDWMAPKFANMDRYFSNHVVMIETDTHRRITGIDDVLEQYELFVEDTEIVDFKITELLVDLVEDTAVAYVTYDIKYEMDETRFDETNTEILVFHEHDKEWKIVWRTQLVGT